MENETIQLIKDYALSYNKLDDYQKDHSDIIPIGDQKTGAIGEFLACLILKKLHPQSDVKIGTNHSQKGYDIVIRHIGKEPLYVQVKTISEYNKYQKTSVLETKFNQNETEMGIDLLMVLFLEKSMLKGEYSILNKQEFEGFHGKMISRNQITNIKSLKPFNYEN